MHPQFAKSARSLFAWVPLFVLILGSIVSSVDCQAQHFENGPVFENFSDSIYRGRIESVFQQDDSFVGNSVFQSVVPTKMKSCCGCVGDYLCMFREHICSDFRNFFNRRSCVEFSTVFLVAAAFANTRVDENFRNWSIEQELTAPAVDCPFSDLGAGEIVVPAMFLGAVASQAWQKFTPHHSYAAEVTGVWSYRSFRSLLVGAPFMLFTQSLTGGSRPGESRFGSGWRPFNDDNGVSGHAFVGAVPFLVAARMTDRPLAKAAFYVGSGLAGYNRICDHSHYLSQVMLGWTFAHISVRATSRTAERYQNFRMMPMSIDGNYGVGFEIRR